MIQEANDTGTVLRRYVPGPGTDEPVVWYEGSGTADRRWLHTDERGSVIAISSGSGTMLGINRYDEYGIPQSGNVGRFQYTGQAWLGEIGLYHYKARMYSPTLGRFLQTDPIGYGDGLNLYNYVGSDPVNFTDPSGLGLECSDLWIPSSVRVEDRFGSQFPPEMIRTTSCRSTPDRDIGRGHSRNPEFRGDRGGSAGGGGGRGKICYGPPAAPGTGATESQLASQVRNNAEAALKQTTDPTGLLWFYSQVRNKGPMDYKQYLAGFQDFGNYNYGYVGASLNIRPTFLLQQAGIAQRAAGTSRPEWGKPPPANGLLGMFPGTPPYGDDPHDQEMIRRGIADRLNGC